MSTTETPTQTQTEHSPRTDADASITPTTSTDHHLECPIEGQILSMHHKCGGGRLECPRCNSRWEPQEVLV